MRIVDDSPRFATAMGNDEIRKEALVTNVKWMGMTALACLMMATVGCGGNKKANDPMAMNAGVTDISVVPPAPVAAPAPIATPVQPVVSDAPTQAPAPVAAAPAGGKYTVQKGDTLWKIATASYGDGKQWQKIASANPGLSPSSLKAGQTIMIP